MSFVKIETTTISIDRFKELLKIELWMECLEAAGVDNWSGVGEAQKMFDREVDGICTNT